MIIRTKTRIGAALRQRPHPIMTTRKLKLISLRSIFSTSLTTGGDSRSSCLTIIVLSQPKIDPGKIVTRDWSQLGDLRIEGVYTGFFPDLSAGVNLGLKLPTGSYTFDSDIVDRDSQLGTGSTDILMGGFYRNSLTKDGKWNWFAQAELDLPVFTQDSYRPGLELDTAAGIYYKGWWLGPDENFAGRTNDLFGTNERQRRKRGASRGVGFPTHPAFARN